MHGFTAGYGSIGNSLLHEVVDVGDRKADAGRIPNVRERNRAECNATMLIDINGQNGILACFRKRPLCFVQVVGAVNDIAYLAAKSYILDMENSPLAVWIIVAEACEGERRTVVLAVLVRVYEDIVVFHILNIIGRGILVEDIIDAFRN